MATALLLGGAAALAQTKKPVKTADDLPRHTYDFSGKPLDLVKNKSFMLDLAAKVKADCESDLRDYDIQDRSMLEAYQLLLQEIDIINGRYDQALVRSPAIRDLQEREGDKLMSGLSLRAHVAALKDATAADGTVDHDKYTQAFKAELTRLIQPLPMDAIHDQLQQRRAASKMLSEQLVEAGLTPLGPMIASNAGKVPGEVAAGLISTRFLLDYGISIAQMAGEVYGDFLDGKVTGAAAAATPKKDIWTPTLVNLDPAAHAAPVVVAVWDTGFDTTLFPGRLWTNPDASADTNLHSNSPFKNDIHGIAFTLDHRPTSGDLYPLNALKTDKQTLLGYLSASMDMQAGISSPAVDALQKYITSLRADQVQDFMDDMGIVGNYSHGTHVAGIVAAGNPFVRLMEIRETFDYKQVPDKAPTLEDYQRWGESAQAAVNYAKAAHVRVVNMSWRIPRAAVEAQLALKGVGKAPEERAQLSRQIFDAFKDRLDAAIAGAPDILFVAGAGNEDNDADFSEYIPAGLRQPNLLTVSAVDESGKPTNFTTTGRNIDLYADGYQIDSVIPGGQHMKFSGTSMASPQVANLAAKLIALKPDLTVEQTIALIRKGATPLESHPGKFIINPAASVALLGK